LNRRVHVFDPHRDDLVHASQIQRYSARCREHVTFQRSARTEGDERNAIAIAHLEEDQDNPFTMELLVQAYYQTSQPEKVHEIEVKLRGMNVPTMEQALVVPAARLRKPTS